MPVWYPALHVTGNEHNKHLDPLELAEEYKKEVDDHERVIVIETGPDAREVFIEYDTDRDGYQLEGWHEIGTKATDIDDYDVISDIISGIGDDNLRMVFDYTNDTYSLEYWKEAED